jgi:hypothetical protein
VSLAGSAHPRKPINPQPPRSPEDSASALLHTLLSLRCAGGLHPMEPPFVPRGKQAGDAAGLAPWPQPPLGLSAEEPGPGPLPKKPGAAEPCVDRWALSCTLLSTLGGAFASFTCTMEATRVRGTWDCHPSVQDARRQRLQRERRTLQSNLVAPMPQQLLWPRTPHPGQEQQPSGESSEPGFLSHCSQPATLTWWRGSLDFSVLQQWNRLPALSALGGSCPPISGSWGLR